MEVAAGLFPAPAAVARRPFDATMSGVHDGRKRCILRQMPRLPAFSEKLLAFEAVPERMGLLRPGRRGRQRIDAQVTDRAVAGGLALVVPPGFDPAGG